MTNIKVIKKEGKNNGKTLVILAGVHGNEKAGVKAFDKLIPKLKIKKGTVFFIYANLKALKQNKRFIDFNLNRCFNNNLSKEIRNSAEGKTALEIIPYLKKANFVLDIHESNSEKSKPFIISEKNSFYLIKFLPAEIVTTDWGLFYPSSSVHYANSHGGDGIAIELGYLGDPRGVDKAENVILNFLTSLNFIEGEPIQIEKQDYYKLKEVYKNTSNSFTKSRKFSDFEILREKTLIGNEGENKIYREKGDIMLFVRDRDEINTECFIVLEKIS